MTAKASSVYEQEDSTWGPQLAIDGKISNSNHSIYHSNGERNPWLEIDFGGCKTVTLVRIKHRVDCCIERFKNAQLSLYTENDEKRTNKAQLNFDGPAQANQPTDFDFLTPTNAHGLFLELEGIAILQVLIIAPLLICYVGMRHFNLGE